MFISLIIATYQRPDSLSRLLESINAQTHKPDEILIIDGSKNDRTEQNLKEKNYQLPIIYIRVQDKDRGSAQQRNFGIKLVNSCSDVIAFLDDDIKAEPDYFKELMETYKSHPDAIGVGGIDLKSNNYFKKEAGFKYNKFSYYEFNGWVVREPLRNRARKLFGLMTNLQPGLIPKYSHGRSVLPPDGNIYQVEHFMGGISSYRKDLFSQMEFSDFFEGYGLYEDFDFCVRALKYGKLYVNTNAKVWHYHEPSGRPDFYKYGKMVVRNGWYVWRVRFPNPSFKAKLKWHAITVLLAHIRLANAITGPDRRNAFMDYLGRMIAWIGVCIKPPVIENYQ